YEVKAYPTQLIFSSLDREHEVTVKLDLKGPVLKHHLELGLDKLELTVRFHLEKGFVSYRLKAEREGIYLFLDRHYEKSLLVNVSPLALKDSRLLIQTKVYETAESKKLYLGA